MALATRKGEHLAADHFILGVGDNHYLLLI